MNFGLTSHSTAEEIQDASKAIVHKNLNLRFYGLSYLLCFTSVKKHRKFSFVLELFIFRFLEIWVDVRTFFSIFNDCLDFCIHRENTVFQLNIPRSFRTGLFTIVNQSILFGRDIFAHIHKTSKYRLQSPNLPTGLQYSTVCHSVQLSFFSSPSLRRAAIKTLRGPNLV